MFSNSKIVLYLRRNSLELYSGDRFEKLELPTAIVDNIEIKDLVAYKKLFSDFITRLNLKKQSGLVVLADDIIFSKIISDGANDQPKIQQFIETVPFKEDKIVSKTVISDSDAMVFVTNQDIYGEVISLLESLNWTVKAVVPLNMFKSSLSLISDNIDPQIAKKIQAEHDLIDSANFLLGSEGQTKRRAKSYPITLLLLLGLIVIASASLYLASTFGLLKNPLEYLSSSKQSQSLVEESPKPTEATNSATADDIRSLSKDGLKVQVLNGSGITGQASKVKSQLANLRFTEIETGNAIGISTEDTIVVFSDKVSAGIQTQVKTELEKTYSEVTIEEATVTQFDILITTGTNLVE